MDKKTLTQYRALMKEAPKLKRDIETLHQRLEKVPTVTDKVMRSSKDWPYILEHVTVLAADPVTATAIKDRIRIKERRLMSVEAQKADVEEFVASIKDSRTRQVVEMVYLDGMTMEAAGEAVGYSKGRVSQIIAELLEGME